MSNRVLIIVFYFSLGLVLLNLVAVIGDFSGLLKTVSWGSSLYILSGSWLLIRNGEFIRTLEFKLVRIGIACIIIGVMFKIMHWPFSAIIIAMGNLFIIGLYFKSLIGRRNKTWINWAKLLFISLLLISSYFKIVHWPFDQEMFIGALFVLGVLVYQFSKGKRLVF